MKSLRIYNMRSSLYKRLQQLAYINKISLNSQTIDLLTKAIKSEMYVQQKDVLASIQSRRFKISGNVPLTIELLREDRKR